MVWTEERVEQLKALWAEGYSATRIAGLMRGVTRSAVLGKVHRLGLSDRKTKVSLRGVANGDDAVVSQSQSKPRRRPRLYFGVPRPELKLIVNPEPPARMDAAIWEAAPGEKPVPLLDVGEDMCRWPLGDPKTDGFGFCGCPKVPGYSFCAHHKQLAFRAEGRRRK